MLLMSLLGVMSGYSSLRGWADFMESHSSATLCRAMALEQASGKDSTLRRMAREVGDSDVSDIFHHWVQQS